jgi:hypothetical protein
MNRPLPVLTLAASLAVLNCSRESPAGFSTASTPAANATPKLPALDAQAAASPHRTVIRNADLAIEDDDPGRARQQAIAAVEQLGGFALSSDAVSAGREAGRAEALRVELVLRVPAAKFETALAALRGLGRDVGREQVTGQDVSEEYIDLEARIRTERALEAQLLEILKSTRAVSEMMEVHGRLADVRGEIEKMEGRRRFLDDRTSLSTIRLEIAGPASGGGRGFGDSARRAGGDMVAVASAIVTGGIRVAGVLLPVFVIIVVPGWAIWRAVIRRRAARRALEL